MESWTTAYYGTSPIRRRLRKALPNFTLERRLREHGRRGMVSTHELHPVNTITTHTHDNRHKEHPTFFIQHIKRVWKARMGGKLQIGYSGEGRFQHKQFGY